MDTLLGTQKPREPLTSYFHLLPNNQPCNSSQCFPTELPVSCTFSCVSQSEASTCDQDFHFNVVFVHIHPWPAWRYGHYIFKKKRKHTHTNQKHWQTLFLSCALDKGNVFVNREHIVKMKSTQTHYKTHARTHTHTIPGSNWDIRKTLTLTWTTTKMWIIG